MIEFKLKAKNCNRGQLFRPHWVSPARCSSKKLSNQHEDQFSTKMQTVMSSNLESKCLRISQCDMQNAWQRTIGKNPEYHVVVVMKLRTDKNPGYPIDGNRWSENQSIDQYQSIKLVNWYWLVSVNWWSINNHTKTVHWLLSIDIDRLIGFLIIDFHRLDSPGLVQMC